VSAIIQYQCLSGVLISHVSTVESQSMTSQLLHAVLLGRASLVATSVAFEFNSRGVIPMIVKPITAVLPLCSLDLSPFPRLLPW